MMSEQLNQDNYIIFLKNNIIDNDTFVLKDIPFKNFVFDRSQIFEKKVINNYFSTELCNKIIDECELYAINRGGWTTDRHATNPTTDLCVKDIKNILPVFLEIYTTIIGKIKEIHNIFNENNLFTINDAFVVKYEHDKQNELEMHSDAGDVTVNILLNDPSDFEGGGTFFEEGNQTYFLNRGDMLIHRAISTHSGLKITKGKRYVLVIFIEVYDLTSGPL